MELDAILKETKDTEQSILIAGLTGADAIEFRTLDRLMYLADELIRDLEHKVVMLLPEAEQVAYYNEKTRLYNLHTQYLRKQGDIIDNRITQRKGGKVKCQVK